MDLSKYQQSHHYEFKRYSPLVPLRKLSRSVNSIPARAAARGVSSFCVVKLIVPSDIEYDDPQALKLDLFLELAKFSLKFFFVLRTLELCLPVVVLSFCRRNSSLRSPFLKLGCT